MCMYYTMQIYSWGCNGNGQLGIGNTIAGYYCPQLVKMQTIFTSVCVYTLLCILIIVYFAYTDVS